ncbi:uncharacterized protein LOC122292545 [Carya illinoinensis]|uniref:uncharacterized protein LOC122292545 n=1 Tax=Carya illinoinensis TaxID=32201 RepID=UPI001C71C711|nr:uncharacterized protein LOC122292545 [Carya illinoinensis]
MGTSCRREGKWTKPDAQWVKANWDASISAAMKKVGMGMVIWDEEGEIMAYLCTAVDCLQDPTIGEALALRRAMLLCEELGFLKVILEGDSQVIVKAINRKEDLYTESMEMWWMRCGLDDH